MTPFWMAYLTALSFASGLCVGSFLNVCILRIPSGQSIVRPRSRCPACGKGIAWYDNLPVLSYLLLGGKCRHCRSTISLRYPLIELLTGLLFLAVWNRYGFTAQTPLYWVAISGLIFGSVVDLDHLILPDRVTLGGIASGLVLSALVPSLHGELVWSVALARSAVGALAGAGILYAVAVAGRWWLKQDAMGLGDVKLLGAIGAWLGVQAVLFTLVVSSAIGALFGVILIAIGGLKWKSRIPFGPFIAGAAVVWMLGGDHAWNWYVTWIQGGH